LAAYFWGYIFTQLPGGRVAEMFSAKWVIWASVMINVVFTLLTPVAAQISYIAVLVVRFIEGLGAVRGVFDTKSQCPYSFNFS
jgi:ACS family sodium-dependent inorganic phosphate cotransporter